jgi:hypothetical protein
MRTFSTLLVTCLVIGIVFGTDTLTPGGKRIIRRIKHHVSILFVSLLDLLALFLEKRNYTAFLIGFMDAGR